MTRELAEKIVVALAPLRDAAPFAVAREALTLAAAFDAAWRIESAKPAPSPSLADGETPKGGSPESARDWRDVPKPAAPSRPEWVPKVGERVRVLKDDANHADVKAGDEYVVTALGWDPYPHTEAYGCGLREQQYVRIENLEPCAAPSAAKGGDTGTADAMPCVSPAASPAPYVPTPAKAGAAAYVPKVGDVVDVGVYGGIVYTGYEAARSPFPHRGFRLGDKVRDGWMDGTAFYYLRSATPAERAAAGLPVEAPAFDEAKEREAARVAVSRDAGDDFTRGWLARARVSANGGVA